MRSRGAGLALMERRAVVDTHRLANITLAIFEHTRVVVSRHVPEAAQLIIDMLAVRRGIGTGFASPEAEFVEPYEFRPFVHLRECPIRIGEDKTTDWISKSSSAMWI